jgi:DNA-binding transcriptional MerR regulator
MQLDIIHEKAIDLFVAGKRQHEVATELNVTTRTIRRWCEDEEFSKTLSTQHRISRNLELGERAQVGRDRRDIHRKTMEQLLSLLSDPETPASLRAVCLKLGMQDAQFDQRQFEAQEWRERVHAERAAERRASQAATLELMNARGMLNRSEKFLDAMKVNGAARTAGVPTSSIPSPAPTVNKTPNAGTEVRSETPALRPNPARPQAAPVKPVRPIRGEPQYRTKADKTGHAFRNPGVPPGQMRTEDGGLRTESQAAEIADARQTRHAGQAIIDRICAEIIRASFARETIRPDFMRSQVLIHTLASTRYGRARQAAVRNRRPGESVRNAGQTSSSKVYLHHDSQKKSPPTQVLKEARA